MGSGEIDSRKSVKMSQQKVLRQSDKEKYEGKSAPKNLWCAIKKKLKVYHSEPIMCWGEKTKNCQKALLHTPCRQKWFIFMEFFPGEAKPRFSLSYTRGSLFFYSLPVPATTKPDPITPLYVSWGNGGGYFQLLCKVHKILAL